MVSWISNQLSEVLAIAGIGMLGIFLVTGILIGAVRLLNRLTK